MMKEFVYPEIELRDLSPVRNVMDDITFSGEITSPDNEQTVTDPAAGDEATW